MSSESYIERVLTYIRSKEAKIFVSRELEQHLSYSKQAWMKQGLSELEAEQKAIQEMGSASHLGKEFNVIHKPKLDFWLISAMMALITVGFIVLTSINYEQVFGGDLTGYYFTRKTIQCIILFVLMALIIRFDYRYLAKWAITIYLAAIILLALNNWVPNVIINGTGMVKVGPFSSSIWIILSLLVISFSQFFSQQRYGIKMKIVLIVIPFYFMLMNMNHSEMLVFSIVLVTLFLSNIETIKGKLVAVVKLIVGFSVFVLGLYFIFKDSLQSYQLSRLYGFLKPYEYAETSGYLPVLLTEVFQQAKLLGPSSNTVIPMAESDLVLVQLFQQFGIIRGIIVITIILLLAGRLIFLAMNLQKGFGRTLMLAICAFYGAQSFYSIAMVFGIVPIISIPLPFISYGGMSAIINGCLIGLALSIYKRKTISE